MDEKVKEFLDKIRMIESSGGKDTDHPMVTTGANAGHKAIGEHGLMPNTALEMINREKLANGKLDPDYQDMYKEDPNYVAAKLYARPDLQERLNQQLALRLMEKFGGDQDKMAYSWNVGHNTPAEKITPDLLDTNDYVRKFRNISSKVKGK